MRTYAELLQRQDGPCGSSWGLFGNDDELGTINFITPERIREAAQCIRRGAVFNLDCPVNAFDPPVARHRQTARHTIFSRSVHHRDDYLDGFYMQATSQVDGLRHFRHPLHGFYNHAPDDSIGVGMPRIGIQRWAERGIVGRGALIDVERYLAERGEGLDHRAGQAFGVDLLDAAAAAQGLTLRPGDILMLRTGWLRFYRETLTAAERSALPHAVRASGLLQSHDTLAWLWDHQIALCAADNFALECIPPDPSSPFAREVEAAPDVLPDHAAMMHPFMIALLGLAVGELWSLDGLAEDCARDGVWECFVTVKPLNLVGGVGSPANALAVK